MILSDACFYIDTRSAASDNHFCFRPLACICCTATSWLFCFCFYLLFIFYFYTFTKRIKIELAGTVCVLVTWIRFTHFCFPLSPASIGRPTAMSRRPFYLRWPYYLVCSQPFERPSIFCSFLQNVIFCVAISAEHHYIFDWSDITDNPNLNTHTTWIYSVLINCESLPCESLPFLFLSLAMKGWDSQKQFS